MGVPGPVSALGEVCPHPVGKTDGLGAQRLQKGPGQTVGKFPPPLTGSAQAFDGSRLLKREGAAVEPVPSPCRQECPGAVALQVKVIGILVREGVEKEFYATLLPDGILKSAKDDRSWSFTNGKLQDDPDSVRSDPDACFRKVLRRAPGTCSKENGRPQNLLLKSSLERKVCLVDLDFHKSLFSPTPMRIGDFSEKDNPFPPFTPLMKPFQGSSAGMSNHLKTLEFFEIKYFSIPYRHPFGMVIE